jgi:hypothetical protein
VGKPIVADGACHRGNYPSLGEEYGAAAPPCVGKRVGAGNESLDQIAGESVCRGVGPAAGAGLCVDVRDVTLDGAGTHV